MEKINLKSKDIYDALLVMFDSHRYVCMNSYVFNNGYESDFLSITADKNQYIYEIEVKVSVADFKKDFNCKVAKHNYLSNASKELLTIGTDGDFPNSDRDLSGKNFITLEKGKCSPVAFINPKNVIPNRFLFATPKGLLKPEMIPEYAGLIEVELEHGKPKAKLVKKAPLLHKQNNFSRIKDTLLDKFWWETFNNRNYIRKEGNYKKFYDEKCRDLERSYQTNSDLVMKIREYEDAMEKSGIDYKKVWQDYLDLEKLKKSDRKAYAEKIKQLYG